MVGAISEFRLQARDSAMYRTRVGALGYYLLGSGEGNALRGRGTVISKGSYKAKMDFNVFEG